MADFLSTILIKVADAVASTASREAVKLIVADATGSLRKLHSFKIKMTKDYAAKRNGMERTVKEQGGKFAGDDSAGCFILGWVQGSYTTEKGYIEVTIHDKGWLDSLTDIEHNIREMYADS